MHKYFKTIIVTFTMLLSSCSTNATSSSNHQNSNSNNTSYLTSESEGTATIRIFKDNNSTAKNRYIAPKNVHVSQTYSSLSGVLANNEYVCPSLGDVNLLVIPVNLPGQEKYRTDEIKNDIKKVFFGENDERNGFVSVKEFYHESSYQKLNFNGTVTDWFDVEKWTKVKSPKDVTMGDNGTIINEILKKAVQWAEDTQNINLKDYDKNNDGSIDAVWLVYNHLDFMSEMEQAYKNGNELDVSQVNQAFGNFTAWDWSTAPSFDKPTTSAFSWASFNSMYSGYAPRDENKIADYSSLKDIKLDSHIYIHETGHLMGLDDYYASDDPYYHPMGKLTMMDQNVCDLDSYSKLLLGWVTPYVVYGTSEILIPAASKSDKAVIVIPTNYDQISKTIELLNNGGDKENFVYEFNPFSEYLLIDLYTPTNLNYQDSHGTLTFNKEASMRSSGVRIYHVDSRIFKCKVVNYEGGTLISYADGYEWDGYSLASDEQILMPISNNKTEHSLFQLPEEFDYYDQVRLIEANMINSFNNNGHVKRSSLWNTDSAAFDIKDFGYQFFNGRYSFNNGVDLPFKIQVNTLKEVN